MSRITPPHILTLVLLGALSSIPMNIYLPSLPAMAEYFDTSYAVMQLTLTGYLALTAVAQFIVGPLSDRYGRRPVLLIALIIFIVASIGCASSTSLGAFFFFRGCQAVVATGIALTRTIIRDQFATGKSASLIGYVTMGMAMAPMLAPLVGGLTQESFGWQGNFWILTIAGLFVFLLAWLDMGETNSRKSASFRAQFKHYPELFRSRRFWGYALTSSFSSATFFALLGAAPLVGKVAYGLSPAQLGAYFIFTPLGYLIGNGISGAYTQRVGLYRMITVGTALTLSGMSCAVFALLAGFTHPMAFFAFTLFIGLGNGISLPSSNTGVMTVRADLAGTASGIAAALMTMGGAAFANLSGWLIGDGRSALPLAICIVLTATFAFVAALVTVAFERKAHPDEFANSGL